MIYLDYNATTPIDERVLAAMMPFLTHNFANASSNHAFGTTANDAVQEARAQIATLIGAQNKEIVFTSGATEALNLAIKGTAEAYRPKGQHLITLQTEHKAVLDTCQYMESIGYEVSYLPVQHNGLVDLELLQNTLRKDTVLVAVMLANNETGVIQPIQEIAALAHAAGAFFCCDATQAFGKIPTDVEALGIDLMAFSGHKIYAPKGVGGLYVKQGIKPLAVLHGGGHEKGMRSGTLNVAGIVALGEASALAQHEMKQNAANIGALRDLLEQELLTIADSKVNGDTANRLYNTINIYFKDVDSDALITALPDIAMTNGSACTSRLIEPSHVLRAMGMTDDEAFQCIRFSLGKYTTPNEVKDAAQKIKVMVKGLRELLG